MINRNNRTLAFLMLLFVVLMSIPYLIPGCGYTALVGFVPLLCMDRIASETGMRKFWRWHYTAFLLWNLVTTFWVCNATLGGGLFASFANAFQMSLVFGLFRWSKKRMRAALPYIFLVVAWIAWERYYLTIAHISWPWLLLGNAFARTVKAVQWYEFTGVTGGSLWVWVSNLTIFGIMVSLSSGGWLRIGPKARGASILSLALVLVFPTILSFIMWNRWEETSDPVPVMIVQPNIDPYNKFTAMTQAAQDDVFQQIASNSLKETESSPDLVIAPETFTNDVVTNQPSVSSSLRRMLSFLRAEGLPAILIGASGRTFLPPGPRPSPTARPGMEGTWYESHNLAVMLDSSAKTDLYLKSKLVVGVEKMPYPSVFRPLDEALGGVMGHCVGQESPSTLNFFSSGRKVCTGVAICYESIYPEWCAGFVKAGAQMLAVITNDAWWGNTPGYRQHCSYSALRAIETRRDIARCANTGISCIINQRGEIMHETPWWEEAVINAQVNLNSRETFFVRMGDFIGRICVLVFVLLFFSLIVRTIIPKSVQ